MLHRLICLFLPIVFLAATEAEGAAPKKAKVRPIFVEGLHIEGSVTYTYVDEKHRRRLSLDLYKPANAKEPLPVIVMFFGGGWQNGRPALFAPLAQKLAQLGYVTVVPEYRLSGEVPFPAAVHDCKAAIRWVRMSARRFGMDPNRIATLGGSAGGHLSGFVAATNGRQEFEGQGDHRKFTSDVQAAVVMCGPMDMLDDYMTGRIRKSLSSPGGDAVVDFMGGALPWKQREAYELASPLTHVDPRTPPMLFIDGENDRPRERYGKMWEKMDALGIPYEFALMPDAPHPFWVYDTWFEPTVEAVAVFLKKYLK
ncbi:MAG: alpha/beta hydrolase fold domain-containing protein [Verrucomicrobiia bacterium]|jgi:acetyl esterase/lipase